MKGLQHGVLKGTQKGAVGPDLVALHLTLKKDGEELSLDKRQPSLAFHTSQFTVALMWDMQDFRKAVVCPAWGQPSPNQLQRPIWVVWSPKPPGREGERRPGQLPGALG